MQIAVINPGWLGWLVFKCRHFNNCQRIFKLPVNYAANKRMDICSVFVYVTAYSQSVCWQSLNTLIWLAGFIKRCIGVWWWSCCIRAVDSNCCPGWLTTDQFFNRLRCGSSRSQARCLRGWQLILVAWNPTKFLPSGWNALLATLPFFVPGFLLLLACCRFGQTALLICPMAGAVVAGI